MDCFFYSSTFISEAVSILWLNHNQYLLHHFYSQHEWFFTTAYLPILCTINHQKCIINQMKISSLKSCVAYCLLCSILLGVTYKSLKMLYPPNANAWYCSLQTWWRRIQPSFTTGSAMGKSQYSTIFPIMVQLIVTWIRYRLHHPGSAFPKLYAIAMDL